MKKWTPVIIVLAVILGIALLLSVLKDFLIKSAIEIASPNVIGARITMGEFSLGLFSHQIHIKDFKMYNPPGFPDQVFVDIPEIRVQADIPELFKGKMYFPLVQMNLNKMVVVKNKDGQMNINSLKIIQEQQAANKGKPVKLPVFKVDLCELNIGKVIMEDYTHAPPVRVEAYDVGIKDQKIRNINGLPKLIAAVMIEAIKPTAIRSAGLMAAEAVLGVGFLPALAIGIAVAQDDVDADMGHSFDTVYQGSLNLVHDLSGTVKKTDPSKGQIWAKVYGCDIVFTVQDKGWGKSNIRIKARQYMLPKLEIADGLLYQLTERLK